jgi:hypothetical protein
MKPLLALLTVTLLSLYSIACGAAGKGGRPASRVSSSVAAAATASSVALPEVERRGDADNDSDGYGETLDDEKMAFGHPASASDARAVTALVKRYYAAGAAATSPAGYQPRTPPRHRATSHRGARQPSASGCCSRRSRTASSISTSPRSPTPSTPD